jgi:hypothetical protein
MRTIYLDSESVTLVRPVVATVGFFDGVHRGHQYLVRQVVDRARALGLGSMAITFDRHPRSVLRQDFQPCLLTPLDEKLRLLGLTGVDVAVVLRFDKAMAMLSARRFMDEVLRARLCVRQLIVGYDNRFGHDRADSFDDCVRYGREMGMRVTRASAFVADGMAVSSSAVRAFLRAGDVASAARCLGRDYTLYGWVSDGYKEGRKLGYPTANLDVSRIGQLIPCNGVYAVMARVGSAGRSLPAMTNIGLRPTFAGRGLTVETHIFNFSEDIYGQRLGLSFVRRVRPERKFEDVNALADQLKLDEKEIKKILTENAFE